MSTMSTDRRPRPPTIVRTYRGFRQVDATRWYRRDAALWAQKGYVPVSHSWAPGQWGCAVFATAFFLCLVGIGFFVLLFLLLTRPDGSLVVTYRLQQPAGPTALPAGTLASRLEQLDEAHQGGLITEAEYEAKRADLLARH